MPDEQASNLGYWNDSDFNAQRDAGLSARNKPRSLLPKRPFAGSRVGDTILNALLGVSAGVKAGSDVNKLGDPILSFLTGAGGAVGAPKVQDIRDQRDVAQSQAEIQRLQLTPLKTVAPGIAEKYGLNPDMPLGLAKEVLPIVARAEDLEKQLLLITARGEQSRKNIELSSEEKEGRNIIDEKAASSFSRESGLPPDVFLGQRREDVRTQLTGFRPARAQATSLIQTRKFLAELRARYDELSREGKLGPIEGRARSAASRVSGGTTDPDIFAYENARKAAVTTIRKLFADSGAPSNFDVERLLNSIPSVSNSPRAGSELWDIVQSIQRAGEGSLLQTSPLTEHLLNRDGAPSAPSGKTAEGIKAAFRAGIIGRDEAKRQLKEIGFSGK